MSEQTKELLRASEQSALSERQDLRARNRKAAGTAALVEKWRREAARYSSDSAYNAMNLCADDLAEALRADNSATSALKQLLEDYTSAVNDDKEWFWVDEVLRRIRELE